MVLVHALVHSVLHTVELHYTLYHCCGNLYFFCAFNPFWMKVFTINMYNKWGNLWFSAETGESVETLRLPPAALWVKFCAGATGYEISEVGLRPQAGHMTCNHFLSTGGHTFYQKKEKEMTRLCTCCMTKLQRWQAQFKERFCMCENSKYTSWQRVECWNKEVRPVRPLRLSIISASQELHHRTLNVATFALRWKKIVKQN